MARRRKRKQIDSGSGGGSWITSFSDLMTLLLTFFILLFSMSSVSEEKFSAASSSLQNALVGEAGGESILDNEGLENDPTTQANDIPAEVTAMYEQALKVIEEEGISDQVTVSSDQDGVYLDIQDSILFDSGEAIISEEGKETLNSLVELLKMTDNDIIIEGYTDNVPAGVAEYDTNWELSAGRAMAVVRYLSEEKGLSPYRLSGRGYGEFKPEAPNDSSENRAKNRRVNIVIVYQPEEEI